MGKMHTRKIEAKPFRAEGRTLPPPPIGLGIPCQKEANGPVSRKAVPIFTDTGEEDCDET